MHSIMLTITRSLYVLISPWEIQICAIICKLYCILLRNYTNPIHLFTFLSFQTQICLRTFWWGGCLLHSVLFTVLKWKLVEYVPSSLFPLTILPLIRFPIKRSEQIMHSCKTLRPLDDYYFVWCSSDLYFRTLHTPHNYHSSVYLICFHLAMHTLYHPPCGLTRGLTHTIHNGNQLSWVTKQLLPPI